MKLSCAAAALLGLAAVVSAEKDDSYYSGMSTSPLANENMFWKEGYNVLQDLDQFEALYVTYHSCAWEYPLEKYQYNDNNENDDDGAFDDDYTYDVWYLKSVPRFRPNVAFSLYGILKGNRDTGCNKHTFINSFHTTEGFETFTNAMVGAGRTDLFSYVDRENMDTNYRDYDNGGVDTVSSRCFVNEDKHDEDVYGNAGTHGEKYETEAVSYGVGCSAPKHTFAVNTYHGYRCDAHAILKTNDGLENFNNNLHQVQCVPIYRDSRQESNQNQNAQYSGFYYKNPVSILSSSKACNLHDGRNTCPDPHGKLRHYYNVVTEATGATWKDWHTYERSTYASYSFLGLGGLMMLAASAMLIYNKHLLAERDLLENPTKLQKSASKTTKSLKSRSSRSKQTQSKEPSVTTKSKPPSIAESSATGTFVPPQEVAMTRTASHKSAKSTLTTKSAATHKSTLTNKSAATHKSAGTLEKHSVGEMEITILHGDPNDDADTAENSNKLKSNPEEDSVMSAISNIADFLYDNTKDLFVEDEENAEVEMEAPKSLKNRVQARLWDSVKDDQDDPIAVQLGAEKPKSKRQKLVGKLKRVLSGGRK